MSDEKINFRRALLEFLTLPISIGLNPLVHTTIDRLVFQAQHELDLSDKGDIETIHKKDYEQVKKFIKKYGVPND